MVSTRKFMSFDDLSEKDYLIEIETALPNNPELLLPRSFPKSWVAEVRALDDERSALVLKSGETISFACAYRTLKEKIFINPDFNEEGMVDLRLVGAPEPSKLLAISFNPQAEGKPPQEEPPYALVIRAFLRFPHMQTGELRDFLEPDIDWARSEEATHYKTKLPITRLYFKGQKEPVSLDIPLSEFINHVLQAKSEKRDVLDIVDITRPNLMHIKLYLRGFQRKDPMLTTIREADFSRDSMVETESIYGGKCFEIHLRNQIDSPQPCERIVDMKLSDFRKAFSAAKEKGDVLLDLTKQSNPARKEKKFGIF